MSYKLYINNKLFNGIGNNNYNKGTIAINGTVYQFDNSSSAVVQTYLYKVIGTYNNGSGCYPLIQANDNNDYISKFYLYYNGTTENTLNTNTITTQTIIDSDDDSTLTFNGSAGCTQRTGRSSTDLNGSYRYFEFIAKYSGKVKFFYHIGSNQTDTSSNISATIYFSKFENNTLTEIGVCSAKSGKYFETPYFTVNSNTNYYLFANVSSSRFYIAGFKFVAD